MEIHTNNGVFQTRYVVNAAGVYADKLHNMVSEKKIHITPRRGDYCLLDKSAGSHVSKTIFALPGKYGKGILVAPTVHGNLILGPTAIDIEDKEGTNTTREGLDQVIERAEMNVKNIPLRQVITSFAGLRAHEDGHEFLIGEVEDAKGFIDCAGIESPGLYQCTGNRRNGGTDPERENESGRKRRFYRNKKGRSGSEYTQQGRKNGTDQRETGIRKYYLPL